MIRKLSNEIIGKIAAGEVVERPASVVKELVENAIDAEATLVTVELRGGGVDYIRISDNGKGIPAEQIRLAFERHATSKLQSAEQLFDIHTLGFRGEALASIAAVAKVSCTTKTADAAFGTRCTVRGGEFTDILQAASPAGTTLIVEDLFFNTPVRRRFLKKPAVEASMVSEFMLRLILSHPEIAFRFVNEGKTVYRSTGDGKMESALFCLYGKDTFAQMQRVTGSENGVMLEGYVGVGELCRGNRQQQSFFVNGRYFKSALLSRALESGCEGRVMAGRFPICALFLHLPYQNVDVNVHPNKLEVRFQNEAGVSEAVRELTAEAMRAQTLGQRLNAKEPEPAAQALAEADAPPRDFTVVTLAGAEEAGEPPAVTRAPNEPAQPAPAADAPRREQPPAYPAMPKPAILPPVERSASPMRETLSPPSAAEATLHRLLQSMPASLAREPESLPAARAAAPPSPELPAEQTVAFAVREDEQAPRLLGVAFDTYWIFESGDRLLLVDQHAAHERILYDRMMKRLEGEQISQPLLTPQLVELSPSDLALARELSQMLYDAGFEVERFDERSVAVKAVPTIFGRNESPKALFLETLDEWQAGRGGMTPERMRRQIAQMACKHAIKGGDRLNENELKGLWEEMRKSGSMPTCPHGRPIVVEITRHALEKRFKRVL